MQAAPEISPTTPSSRRWAALFPLGAALPALVWSARFWLHRDASVSAVATAFEGVLPAIFGLGVLATLWRRPASVGRITLLVVCVVFSLYACEFLIRTLVPFSSQIPNLPERVRRARQAGVPFDVRGRLEVVDDLRRGGVRAYPAVAPLDVFVQDAGGGSRSQLQIGGREVIPLSGVSSVVTVLDNETGQWGTYTADEQGFNNPRGLWDSAPADVVLIGDSFVHGIGGGDGGDLGAHLRRRFPRTVNLGMGGNGPITELATLKEYAAALRPKAVVWFFFENDYADLGREAASSLHQYLEPGFSQDLLHRRADLDAALAALVDPAIAHDRSLATRLGGFLTFQRLRSLGRAPQTRPAPPSPDFDLFARVMDDARRTVEGWGGALYFVFLPPWERFTENLDPGEPARRERVTAILRTRGVPVLDLYDAFMKTGDPLACFPFRVNAHYNPAGYRVAGEATVAWLDQLGVSARK